MGVVQLGPGLGEVAAFHVELGQGEGPPHLVRHGEPVQHAPIAEGLEGLA